MVVLVPKSAIEDEEENGEAQGSLGETEISTVYVRRPARKFTYVNLRGASEERIEVREVSGLHSRHHFLRIGEIDPDR